jgi:WD40 repeat protein
LLAAGGIDWLATGGSDGAVLLWDVVERCETAVFPGGSTCLAFHPSGRWLASASLANTVCLWEVATQRLIAEWLGHEDTVTCLAFSGDGHWLVSGSDDRTVRFWETATGRLVATTELHTRIKGLALAPDSCSLFTSNGNRTCYQVDVPRWLVDKDGWAVNGGQWAVDSDEASRR